MGGHNQETQTTTTTQVAETSATETGGTTEGVPSGPQFTSRGPIPPATRGFKDPPPSPSDVAFGSHPHGAKKPEAKHAEAKHAEARHAEAKPGAKPTEEKVEAKPTETKPDTPAEAKPAEAKPEAKSEAKPAEAKPEEKSPEAKPAKSKDTFLTASQRSRLEAEFIGRVDTAELAYVTALTDLRVDKLVEKEEELPIWLSLLVGVGGMAMESTVTSAVKLLKKSGEAARTIKGLGAGAVEHELVESHVAGLSEGAVEKLVGQLVDTAKEKTLAAVGKPGPAAPGGGAAGDGEDEQKPAELNYIDYLRDHALVLFQNVKEENLSSSSDEELLGVFASFDAKLHSVTMYRAKLEEQIKRYMSSHAKEIGHRVHARDKHPAEFVREEVRVAKILEGSTVRYAYVSREYDQLPDGYAIPEKGIPGKAYESEENALSLEEEGTWSDGPTSASPQVSGRADAVPDQILGYVEPELVDVAIASQDKRWLQKMDTFRLDYSTGSLRLTKVGS